MRSPNPIVDDTLRLKKEQAEAKFALVWAVVNVVGALIVYWDICYNFIATRYGIPQKIVWYSELLLLVILILNVLVDVVAFCKPLLCKTPIVLTPNQKRLLGINDSDLGFSIVQSKAASTPDSKSASSKRRLNMTSTPQSLPHMSWMSSGASSGSPVSASTSWIYYAADSPSTLRRKESPSFQSMSDTQNSFMSDRSMDARSIRMRNLSMSNSFYEGNISDEESLHKYLESYELKSTKTKIALSEKPQSFGTSFWSLGHTLLDYTPLLRKYAYQIASRSSQSAASFTDNDLGSLTHHTGEEVIIT